MTQERMNAITEEIQNRGYEVERNSILKGGVYVDGITIHVGNGNVQPNLYFNNFDDEDVLDGEIADRMIAVANSHKMENFDVDSFFTWDNIKENLQLRVRPHVDNDTCTRELLDLDVFVAALIPQISRADGMASVTIKENHLDHLGITEKQLFNAALDDSVPTYNISGMSNVITKMMGEDIPEELKEFLTPSFEDEQMYVITNNDKMHGAGVLACPSVLDEMARKVNSDVFILPSSIHEVIMTHDNGSLSSDDLKEMVLQVNSTELSPEEILSNHVYRYRIGSGKLEIAL